MRLRKPEHRIQIGEVEFTASAGEMFENVALGEITLDAGLHDVTIYLPQDGAVDYLEFTAPQLPAIAPPGGWQPDEPLRYTDLAMTTSQLLGLEEWLVPTGEVIDFQAEDAKLYDGAVVSTIRHLGEPEKGAWVRAGNLAGRLTMLIDVPPGVYRLMARGMCNQPLYTDLTGKLQRDVEFKPYLEDVDLGMFHLDASQRITMQIPSRCGVDSIRMEAYRGAPDDFLRLTGVSEEDGPVSASDLDDLLALLVTLNEPR